MEEELETVEVGETFLFLGEQRAGETVGEAGGGVGEDAVAGGGEFWGVGVLVHGGEGGGVEGLCMELGVEVGVPGAGGAFVGVEVV